jgi:hypothetical protein
MATRAFFPLRGLRPETKPKPIRGLSESSPVGPLPFARNSKTQRGRGRNPGRYPTSGRGRMRKRGASGGGTLCRGAPQLLHISCGVSCTRNQWPRAAHSGFKHCTVQPGRYCIFFRLTFKPGSGRGTARRRSFLRARKNPPQLAGLCAVRPSVSTKIERN